RDGLGQAVPARHLIAQTLPPRRGQSVVLRPSVVLAHSPLALDESPVLEAVERRVERALLDLESATRDLLDTEQHAIPVQLAEGEGLQDQEVEGAGKEFRGIGHDSLLVELGESVIPTLLSCQGERRGRAGSSRWRPGAVSRCTRHQIRTPSLSASRPSGTAR